MNRYISFLIILFSLYACHRETEYESVSNNESECFVDVFADVDMDVYNSLIVRKEFRDIANLYKENKDAIYTCTEEQLPEQYLKADTIRSLVQYYAKRLDCPNLALYIAKYVESDAEVLTKCMINERVYECWDRAWDYYDDKYLNIVYKRIKDVAAVKKELCNYVSGSWTIMRVLDHVIIKGNRAERFENAEDMKNYLLMLAVPEMTEDEMHHMNATLYDRFYFYYISGDWEYTGRGEPNKGDVCPKCGYKPCLCGDVCSECNRYYNECVCCRVCERFPCICVPAVGKTEYRGSVRDYWTFQDIKSYLADYGKSCDYFLSYYMRFTWSGMSQSPVCVYKSHAIADGPYYIPEFIYSKSGEYANNMAYLIYTDLQNCIGPEDVYSFARMAKISHSEMKKYIPENVTICLMGFWTTTYDTYAFASAGKFGELDEYWKHVDIHDDERGFRDFMTSIYDVELSTNPNQSFASLSKEELLLYRCMAYFQKIGCDIEIYRWDKNARENGDFVKPWKYEK